MTIQELQQRQAWTLDQKIDHAVGTIEAFKARTGHDVYISFSGGKDSTILLDIARRFVDAKCLAVFCNTGNEYPEIMQFVKTFDNVTILRLSTSISRVIRQNGFPLVSKDVSEKIRQLRHSHSEKLQDLRLHGRLNANGNIVSRCPLKWQFLKDVQFDISERCCDELKKKRFKQFEKETGLYPLLGVTAAESRLRTMQYLARGGCNAFAGPRPRSFPISIFTSKDIYDYAHRFNLKLCPIYDSGEVRQTGCMCCGFGAHLDPHKFDYLYKHYPKIYAYFMNLENNGITYRQALHVIGAKLPDDDE